MAFQMQRFSNDPLLRGCWKSDLLGSTKEMNDQLGVWYGNLGFSGEHTCFRQNGYTNGAYLAGTRSVKYLLRDRYGRDVDVRTTCDFTEKKLKKMRKEEGNEFRMHNIFSH